MKHLFYIFGFLLLFAAGYAQNTDTSRQKKIIVLEKKLPHLSGEEKTACVLELSELYWQINPEKSIIYAKQAVELFQNISPRKIPQALIDEAIGFYYLGQTDSTIVYVRQVLEQYRRFLKEHHTGVAYNLLCLSYRDKGEFQSALNAAKKALDYFGKAGDSSRIAGTLDNMSTIYKNMGNYRKSLAYSVKSLKIFEKNNDSIDMAATHSNIANIYALLKDFAHAKQHLNQASVIFERQKSLYYLADLYNNYGTVYMETKAYDSSFIMLQKALELYHRINNKSGEATALQNMGLVYNLKGNYHLGIQKLKQASGIFEALSDVADKTDIYADLGDSYTETGDIAKAKYYLHKALNLAIQASNKRQELKIYALLEKMYAKEKNYKPAFKYAQKRASLKDSLENTDVKKQIANLEAQYQNEKKQKEIEELEHKQKLQHVKSKNQLLVFSILAIVFLFFSYLTYQKRKKEKKIALLELQKSQLKQKQLEQELSYKNKQMATHAINIMQRNKLLQEYLQILKDIKPDTNPTTQKQYNHLKREINKTITAKKDWDSFKTYFEQTNESFVRQLMQNDALTNNDFRLAALIKLGMTNKEIASIFNITTQSVKNKLYRLKKKLQLQNEENLREYLTRL